MVRAAAVVARVSAAPTRRSAVRAAISPSRRLPASRRPPVRRRRAPTVARPGPAGPARAVTARWVAPGRSEAPAVTRAPAAQPETRVPAVLAATRAPAEQVGPVDRAVRRPTAAPPTAARPPGSVEPAELVLAAGLPARFRAARLVRMTVGLVPAPAGGAATLRTLPQVQGPVVRVAAVARVPPAVRTVAPVAKPTVALRVTVPVAGRVTRRVVRLPLRATASPLQSAWLAAVLVARATVRPGHRPVAPPVLAVLALVVQVALAGGGMPAVGAGEVDRVAPAEPGVPGSEGR